MDYVKTFIALIIFTAMLFIAGDGYVETHPQLFNQSR